MLPNVQARQFKESSPNSPLFIQKSTKVLVEQRCAENVRNNFPKASQRICQAQKTAKDDRATSKILQEILWLFYQIAIPRLLLTKKSSYGADNNLSNNTPWISPGTFWEHSKNFLFNWMKNFLSNLGEYYQISSVVLQLFRYKSLENFDMKYGKDFGENLLLNYPWNC